MNTVFMGSLQYKHDKFVYFFSNIYFKKSNDNVRPP